MARTARSGTRGPANPVGIAFYDQLVDELLAANIVPVITAYHWDLPQELEDDDGWANRDTANRFAEYVTMAAARLGDRVTRWTTLNEPWCSAFLGYAAGVHAPGRKEPASALRAAHHLLLAHGLAVDVLRQHVSDVEVSLVLNLHAIRPASPADEAAATKVDGIANRIFLDPVLRGRYPGEVQTNTAHLVNWSELVRDGDLAQISRPIDALGVNYYTPTLVAAHQPGTPERRQDGHGNGAGSPWVGAEDVDFLQPPGPHTMMQWAVDPTGLGDVLRRLGREHPGLPLLVAENGAAYDDYLDPTGRVRDSERIDYLHGHLSEVSAAIADGVDVRGYFVWSLLDNFEWSYGYSRRFGIVYVDFATQRRWRKDSAIWFSEVIAANGLPARA